LAELRRLENLRYGRLESLRYAGELHGQDGPLSPTLSPSEGERGNRRQVSGEPRFRGRESPRHAPCHSLIQRQWGWGQAGRLSYFVAGRRRTRMMEGGISSGRCVT
jgi:hypothetical protein